MAAVAAVAGSPEEARFWRGLPATLSSLKAALPPALKARLNTVVSQASELESGILSAFVAGTSPTTASIDDRYRIAVSLLTCIFLRLGSHPSGSRFVATLQRSVIHGRL